MMNKPIKISSFFAVLLMLAACGGDQPYGTQEDWPVYLGDKNASQYSNLEQITPLNVSSLEVAWMYEAGGASEDNRSQIQCNPIVVNGTLYGTSAKLHVFALNAASGEEIWRFDPSHGDEAGLNANRGVTYWQDENGEDKRILFTAGPTLFCLDAETGKPIEGFGDDGKSSLKQALGRNVDKLYVVSTTPGVVYQDLLIIGTRVSENANAAPGHIRAFDIRTGEVAWTFHTIPQPNEYGYDTWPPDAYKRIGGANSWAGMTLDEERGMVFVPTGSASYDFWGGNRIGENLFANCILALDAATGKRKWHYQTVHHDIWDRDLPASPTLVTVNHNGKEVDAVAQATKSGYIFLLDRDTGFPLFSVEERRVPSSDLNGEQTWVTQPFPTKPPPFSRQRFDPEDASDILPGVKDSVLSVLAQVRSDGQFVPPSREGTIIFPGFDGGAEWGGQAFDPETGLLYVNANEMPWILTMVDVAPPSEANLMAGMGESLYRMNCATCHGIELQGDPTGTYPALTGLSERVEKDYVVNIVQNGKGFMPGFPQLEEREKEALIAFLMDMEADEVEVTDAHEIGAEANLHLVPYTSTGYKRFIDPHGYPAVKPPWGTLNAVDLNKGEIAWSVPLGEFKELSEKGIPQTGTENYGGPAVTKGGVIFIAASKDEHIRAFDKETGKELWKFKLPAGGYATPSTYMVDGRQYVVIACGGGKMGTKSGDKYVAFVLP